MKKCPLLLFVILLTLFLGVNSNATTLTFEGLGPNNSEVPQTYGDIIGLDISYAVKDGFGDSILSDGETVNYWDSGYGDLTDAAFAGSEDDLSRVAEISFSPSDGNSATIIGFDLGFWLGRTSYSTEARIYNHDYSAVLFSTGDITGGPGNFHFGADITSDTTLHLQWRRPWVIAIDNVGYDVSFAASDQDNHGQNPVPEPTTILLSGLGILGMAGFLRRKKDLLK